MNNIGANANKGDITHVISIFQGSYAGLFI